MRFYHDVIFSRVLDYVLSRRHIMEHREQALADAAGDVLEIGFGTGLNLGCYPQAVDRLTIIDPEQLLPRKVAQRLAAAPMPVEKAHLEAEELPFEPGRFDCVVSTWTLCTIPDVSQALGEVRRVLKPGGKLIFLEHGESDDAKVARRQSRWNWLQRIIGCGCNLDRPIDRLIRESGMELERLQRFDMPKMPRLAAHHYLGTAVPA